MDFPEIEFQKEKFIKELITSSYLCYPYVIVRFLNANLNLNV